MSKITLLGTGTCQIEKDRMASSVLIELDQTRVVYDLGRGITQRLLKVGLRHDDVKHIVFSHFHPDHVSEIIPFLHAGSWSKIDPRTEELNIYGGIGVKVQMMRFMSLFGADELVKESYAVNINEIRKNTFFIEDKEFSFFSLPPANNLGLKFSFKGKTYAITGDSSFHEHEVAFLKNVDLAIIDSGHITDDEIIELSVLAQPKIMVCSHLYRNLDEERLRQTAQKQGYKGQLIVGNDLMSFNIDN